jgi:hypothetical protein
MNYLKWIAAALSVLALSACVGVIVPVPLSDSSHSDNHRSERR